MLTGCTRPDSGNGDALGNEPGFRNSSRFDNITDAQRQDFMQQHLQTRIAAWTDKNESSDKTAWNRNMQCNCQTS